ncbi:hypothetical protein DLAC_11683 [Tieghemostelium lacteum]|uniref:Glycophosphotransferase n=1 Tax=Tieghemostelium lacteum TaxID=361077 RepID=A0A151ZC27_TIELA|nr:hypothetical protein DLAC_11683 [Tieghemostelium lacteum]|eukprot:KYQ91507.1 hypothetical protein DLAC_11683 [Tieghemostelium lacteum]
MSKSDKKSAISGQVPEIPVENNKSNKTLLKCKEIDIVYTWVNGSDPQHIASRTNRSGNTRYSAPGNNRYRDLMGLRYSLRSIKKYAPWINNIWVVSAQQYPSWFDESTSEVRFVFHEDLYKNKEDLPTFNSNSIESNFYNLPEEVSDCFIYLNDDIFFGAPVSMTDFFDPNYGQAIYKSTWTAPATKEQQANIWHACIAWTNELLNNMWEVSNGHRHYASHGVQIFHREVFKKMYADLTEEFHQTSSHPFRTAKDLQIPFLYLQYALRYHYTYEPATINHYALLTDDLDKMKKEFSRILSKKSKTVCLNDGLSVDNANPKVIEELKNMFEKYFPEKPSWEL